MGSGPRKVCFDLSSVPEETSESGVGGEGDADATLEELRLRRRAVKEGKEKPKTVAGSTTSRSDQFGVRKSQTAALHTYRDSEHHNQSPSPSSLQHEQPLPSARMDPAPQPSSSREEDSPSPSSDMYSTPPSTTEHNVEVGQGSEDAFTPAGEATASTPDTAEVSVAKTPERSASVASDASEHDVVLDTLRRRRLELKQQREQSSEKKKEISPSSTDNKTETETLSSHVSPQPSTAISPQYPGGGSTSQGAGDLSYTSSGVYCSKCHCKVRLGQKHCDYCKHPVYPMAGGVGSPTDVGSGISASGSAYQSQNVPVDSRQFERAPSGSAEPYQQQQQQESYNQPDSNPPSLPPKPKARHPKVSEQNLLHDPSGYPLRAFVPERKPLRAHAPADNQQPLRARVEDSHHFSPYSKKESDLRPSKLPHEKHPIVSKPDSLYDSSGRPIRAMNESSRARPEPSQVPDSTSSSGATGFPPSSKETGIGQIRYKLERFREHLQKQGKTDAEIDTDPDYILMKEEARRKQLAHPQSPQSSPGYANAPLVDNRPKEKTPVKIVDPNEFVREDMLASGRYSSDCIENMFAMDRLKQDGQQLLEWIKVCLCTCTCTCYTHVHASMVI